MRRSCMRTVMCAVATAVALGSTVPVLGQEDGGMVADGLARMNERIDAIEADGLASMNERIDAIEADVTEYRGSSQLTNIAIAIAVSFAGGAHSAYLVEWLSRHRTRPILSWSMFDDGLPFTLRDTTDGSMAIAVRITNVGHAAAVDIVGHAGVRISAYGASEIFLDTQPNFVGSLHPGASAQVLVTLSRAEHKMVMEGKTAEFALLLRYKAMNNRSYTYRVSGTYSRDVRILVGVVSKAFPE